ncbi:formylglycine-generating enzyme family protein [Pedobacter sp. KBW06]|uniref:formylglycine-generating enzyme family protein n=1 Tax=Pedobacter sp. KBW06 TaxID=2153359 RepID=UPI0018F6E824|nr:SUMF1/EgtB/PvdO family nonheme iron enzyme [Pedobacter sp. KBW06]
MGSNKAIVLLRSRAFLSLFASGMLVMLSFSKLKAQPDSALVKIPAGTYSIGGQTHQLNPLRKISLATFYIAKTEVTNLQFEEFVRATAYRTDAERLGNAMVFEPGLAEFKWLRDSTAFWRFPNGTGRGGIEHKMNHPVTSISYADAEAYCKWAKVRLPGLDEWEVASRAGAKSTYFWGEGHEQIGTYANIWNARDHLSADVSDGYMYTSPVASFKANAFGLYDMYGNVFEFCEGSLKSDPKKRKVVHARGGSWWCSRNSCGFFNSVDIGRVNPHSSFSNQGFRIAKTTLN